MESSPVTCRTLEDYCHVNANTFERQYKDQLSGCRSWDQLDHADEWLVYPENIGPSICIGETAPGNGDTPKQLLARSRYLLFKSADKWTESQKQRAAVLFGQYPDLKEAYSLTHSLRMIFPRNTVKDAARLSLARWYNKVDESEFRSFNVIAAALYEHYGEVLNFFVNRATNAFAESFNAKIKAFRTALRGVTDIKFFMFRFAKIYA